MEPPEKPVTQAPKVPRAAERIFSGELTAGRAARMIAAFTLVATLAGGTLAWLIDRADFRLWAPDCGGRCRR